MRLILNHNRYRPVLWIVLPLMVVANCAVMSEQVRQKALSQLPFDQLIQAADVNQGQTVILGGYVLSVENEKTQTRMVVVQAPLGIGQQPKSKDLSQGRLILVYDGFIDPEVYTKDRQVTVGGKLMGSSATENHNLAYPYVRVQIEEIHLWAKPDPDSVKHHWDDDCYPFGPWRYRHPWYRHFCW